MPRESAPNLRGQLTTRIPEVLRKRVKVHCVKTGRTLTDFVVEALEERLRAGESRRKRA